MSRDALIVGINVYQHLSPLSAPAADANAIAQLLTEFGDFRVLRMPEVIEDKRLKIGQRTPVTGQQLEEKLAELFKPAGHSIPDTALFFFSGHGLRKERGIQEGYLATSDTQPEAGNWGLSLQWLRRLLQVSPVREQIIWLDCCYSGELLNFQDILKEADPGQQEGYSRCFMTASREYQVAFEEIGGHHSLLTGILLDGLDPSRRSDGFVTNHTLTRYVSETMQAEAQQPLFHNSGRTIALTKQRIQPFVSATQQGTCPYKGLQYFDLADAPLFFGRTALKDRLIEKINQTHFLAVVGPSGSGKSSVVRAGLLHELKLGQKLSGSDRWQYYPPFTPGYHPFRQLELITGHDSSSLEEHLLNLNTQKIVLFIDQFEECFSLCEDTIERQQFFDCIDTLLTQIPEKLCVIIAIRADFLGKCAEYPQIARRIQAQESLELVTPMTREELQEVIIEPAELAGLVVEPLLVEQMVKNVENAPGSLPLLEFTLTELWHTRSEPYLNFLTLFAYEQLGGIEGTLQTVAEQVYQSLTLTEQEIAKRIFIELTQLGQGTEDTRRRVPRSELVTSLESEAEVNRVIQKLVQARLIVVTGGHAEAQTTTPIEVIDVAHEALIRHWSRLRNWIEDNRIALRQHRAIEQAAEAWVERGRPQEVDYLWQESKLVEAESFMQQFGESLPLPLLAQEFIHASQAERDRHRRETETQHQRELQQARRITRFAVMAAGFACSALAIGGFSWYQQQQAQHTIETIFLGADIPTKELVHNLKNFLKDANLYSSKVDTLKDKTDAVTAVNYYYKHSQALKKAFAYYHNILTETIKLQYSINRDQKSLPYQDQINSISKKAELHLSQLIEKYRLSELQLKLAQKKFGNSGSLANDPENKGSALGITYTILMHDSGADVDGNGRLTGEQEAEQIPCLTLRQIELRWQDINSGSCHWIVSGSYFFDPECTALSGRNIAFAVFENEGEYIIDRIKKCDFFKK